MISLDSLEAGLEAEFFIGGVNLAHPRCLVTVYQLAFCDRTSPCYCAMLSHRQG